MAAINTAGPAPVDVSPVARATADRLRDRSRSASAAVVDVRMPAEWRRGHLGGAIHLPLPEVPGRVSDLPAGVLRVHCGSGYRALLASSLLANAGRQVVLIDDTFDRARLVGLPFVDGR